MLRHQKLIISSILIILSAFTTLFFSPTSAFANNKCAGVDTAIIDCDSDEENAEDTIYEILLKVVNFLSAGIGILGVIGISIVGVQYLTAGGDETKTRKAKTRMTDIIIGLGFYVVMWALLNWLLPGGILKP